MNLLSCQLEFVMVLDVVIYVEIRWTFPTIVFTAAHPIQGMYMCTCQLRPEAKPTPLSVPKILYGHSE